MDRFLKGQGVEVKIELGFTNIGPSSPFFELDDPVKGVLDSEYILAVPGGEGFVDVTNYLERLSITRGKSRQLDRYNAGQLNASFINTGREFDPTFLASPFYGQIVPKRLVRVIIDGQIQFLGYVDDWNINYDASGFSTASLIAFDAFTQLANLNLSDFEPPVQLSGARIEEALDNVAWSASLRDIDTGNAELEDQFIASEGLISYLTTVEQSEIGSLFVAKDGKVKFVDRYSGYSTSPVVFSDTGSDIPYTNIAVTYGAEFLYNDITITSTAGTAIATDSDSENLYGKRQLERETFLSTQAQLNEVADILLLTYKQPDYRFNAIQVDIDALDDAQRADVLALELGDIVRVDFTPSSIPPQITRSGRVIGISQSHQPDRSTMTVSLEDLQGVPLVLDSPVFGIIGLATLAY